MILHGRIDDKQSTMIVGQLLYLELKDSGKPIKMMINSGGGAVHSALAIHDVMKQISSPVYTSGRPCQRYVFDAGSYIPNHRSVDCAR